LPRCSILSENEKREMIRAATPYMSRIFKLNRTMMVLKLSVMIFSADWSLTPM
jgi:hypothetical protein